MKKHKNILVAGIGNYLMGDEGIGIHVVRQLEKEPLPPMVELLDGGTGGFHLLEYFETHDTVILIDATLDDNITGTIRLTEPRFAADFPTAMSTHEIGLKDLVGSLQLLGKMPRIYLYTISIDSLQQQGIELTPDAAAAIGRTTASIRRLLHHLTSDTPPAGQAAHDGSFQQQMEGGTARAAMEHTITGAGR